MKFNTTQAERNRGLVRDLAKKLKLERSLKIELRRLFNEIGREFQAVYEVAGTVLNTAEYKDEVASLLKRHYRKTAKAFKKNLRNDLKNGSGKILNLDFEEKAHDSTIDEQLREFNKARAAKSSDLITGTVQDDLERNIKDIIVAGAIAGVVLSRKEQARQAKQRFIRNSVARSDAIAATETQAAAENAKDTEANVVLADVDSDGVPLTATSKKQWGTVLDNRTRLEHADADGQIVGFNQPYNIGGQHLDYPGDTSLGASAWNVINCRCASSTIIETGDE